MKKLILISLVLYSFINCKGQDSILIKTEPMREKFNIELYNETKKTIGWDDIKLDNGNIIYNWGFDRSGGFQHEWLPKPSFYKFYKEFYVDGYLKKKEKKIGGYTKVGISQYYDENGKLSQVNEDLKFGKIKPQDALNFLESKGYINLQTGEGRDGFTLTYGEIFGKTAYTIEAIGVMPRYHFQGGLQSAYESIYYIMDAETGAIKEMSEAEFEEKAKIGSPTSSIYKTHNEKNYTQTKASIPINLP